MTENGARMMSAKAFRACLLAALFTVVALAGMAPSGPARAQTVGLSKTLCTTQPTAGDATPCSAGSASAFAAVWYKVVINNMSGPATTIALAESYPSNFQFVGVTCAATNGSPVTTSAGSGGSPISVSLPAGQTVVCIVSGYFTGSGSATNAVSSGSASAQWNSTVPSPTTLPTDLSIVKTASVTQVDVSGAAASIVYTITVTNNGANAVYLGQVLTIRDSLALFTNGVPLNVSYVAGSATCAASGTGTSCVTVTPPSGPAPVNGNFVPFMAWNFPTTGSSAAGYMPVGGSMTITYTVRIERNPLITCIRQPHSDGIRNRAELILDPPGPVSTMVDVNTANNSSSPPGVTAETGITTTDPLCGAWLNPSPLLVTKTQLSTAPPGGYPWSTTVPYRITIKNTSNQTLTGIQLSDFVMAIPGAPPFTASRPTAPTFGSGCSGLTVPFASGASQSVTGYYSPASMGAATLTLLANQTCTITVFPITYSTPTCDAFRTYNNPIRNTFRAVWTGTWTNPPNGAPATTGTFVSEDSYDVNGVLTDTLMADGPPCDIRVVKTPAPGGTGRIEFGVWSTYTVKFINNESFQVSVGTLYDAVRIVQPNYAVSLSTAFQYNCAPVPGISNAPTSGSGVTNVVYTQYPHQGARIINGGAGAGPTRP